MNSPKPTSVEWQALRQGSRPGFSTLFFQYSDELLRYGYRIHPDRELLKDCIQELFLSIWQRRDHLPELVNEHAYLLQAFRRLLLRRIKQDEQNRFERDSLKVTFELPKEEWANLPESQQHLKSFIAATIDNLPRCQREIVYLKYYEGFTYDEICEIMGIKPQAAWNLVSRAVTRLRLLISDRRVFQ
ncbi:MAG: sigma-70 family RNA polymerase sigma factor [Bacteroidota bacterium]